MRFLKLELAPGLIALFLVLVGLAFANRFIFSLEEAAGLICTESPVIAKMAAELLIEQGHKVVLHARSNARADETRKKIAGAEDIVIGDLASIAQTKSVADQVNKLGSFDAVIHNAGIGYREPKLVKTVDGLPQLIRPFGEKW